MTSYYLLEIKQNVEPEIHGPYTSWQYRDDMAILLRADDPEKEHGLYSIVLATTDAPFTDSLKVETFGTQILDPLEQNICPAVRPDPCTRCDGDGMRGEVFKNICPRCHGSGIEPDSRFILPLKSKYRYKPSE